MKRITLLCFALFMSGLAWSQCGPGPDGQYPSGSITVNTDGDVTEISTCNYSTEFSLVDGIVEGNDYEVSITLSGADLYVTVVNSADDSVIAHGASPFNFTAPAGVTGVQLNWSEDSDCTYAENGCRTTSIQDLTAAANACPAPEDFTVSEITDMSADLTWTEGGVSTVDYSVEVYNAGESAADANTPVFSNANVTGTMVTVTGLSASMDYDAYITANCSGATTISELEGPESFTTTASCSDVTDVDTDNLTATSVDITFTPGTGNDSFLVEVYLDGESAADGNTPVYTNTGSGSPESVTGLSAETAYDTFVTGFCGGTATMVVGPDSFTTRVTPPVNDLFADAISVTCGDSVTGTTLGANQDEEDAPSDTTVEDDTLADNDSPWVWYSFVGSGVPEVVTVSTCSADVTDFDTELFIYTGTSGALTLIDDGYDECGGFAENFAAETSFVSDGATTYYIAVGGYNATSVGNFQLSISCAEPCLAEAGTLTADATPVALSGGTATISATPNGDIIVPTDYEVTYVLTSGTSLVIEQAGATPSFEVTAEGNYTIHTLVAETSDNTDPNYLDLSVIVFGTTTGVDVLDLVGENDLCVSLDVTGAPIVVDEELGINDENITTFTYYPNPVKNTLTLNAQNTIEQVAMYNMLGQEVLRTAPNTVDSDLDLSNLETGTYFVKVTIANATKTIRVVKQ